MKSQANTFVKNLNTGELMMLGAGNTGIKEKNATFTLMSSSPDASQIITYDRNYYGYDPNFKLLKEVHLHNLASRTSSALKMESNKDREATGRTIISSSGNYVLQTKGVVLSIRNRQSGEITLVGAPVEGEPFRGKKIDSIYMTKNDRFVVFSSSVSNIIRGQLTIKLNVYLKDLQTGKLELISKRKDGKALVHSDATGAKISESGRYITFISTSLEVIDTNTRPVGTRPQKELFLYDRSTNITSLISIDKKEKSLSIDSFITEDEESLVFSSYDRKELHKKDGYYLLPFFKYQIKNKTISQFKYKSSGTFLPERVLPSGFAILNNGETIVFDTSARLEKSDNNGKSDIFSCNNATKELTHLSKEQGGSYSNDKKRTFGSITFDGRYIAMIESNSRGLEQRILVRDLLVNKNYIVSNHISEKHKANVRFGSASLSSDGSYLVFLVTNHNNLYGAPVASGIWETVVRLLKLD